MKSVALHNLGCKVNSYELDVMQQFLQKEGYKIVDFNQKADIYIINTCTVTNIADRKSRQMIHRAKKQNPDAVVVAVGCYVQTAKEQIESDPYIDLAIGNNRKKEIVTIVGEYLKRRESLKAVKEQQPAEYKSFSGCDKTLSGTTIPDIAAEKEYEEMQLSHTAEHTRAYIKIQDGCNQFCSYCVIPYARGRVRSRRAEDVLAEIQGLVRSGYKEVVLTGIHISSYGLDFQGRSYNADRETQMDSESEGALLALIRKIHAIDGITRIRLGSLEPRIVTEDFAKALSEMPKVCPHFHLSLQSGSDSVLKRMNRRYTCEEFEKGVGLLRKYFDEPAITTDVITGFPGETEEEFGETVDFLKNIRFFEMHVFPYSRREGTVAASMPGQLAEKEKKQRSAVLLEMDRQYSLAYRKKHIGKEMPVLFEQAQEIGGVTYQVGHTQNYIKVAVLSEEDLTNCEVLCTLTEMADEETVFAQKN
ncbi:MAG: tRNA (N(6)-L-threonylcarbamoyladenosine(37)-C(2))-methylthiotransferase MtaB [Lachnospiraceae bacterium]|nr:tRNA (N(6)-L-threonylcarbamoyladenosine(37)-C(2))-methylthiotransferase MtaB [Lachnospiraceae bacterium]